MDNRKRKGDVAGQVALAQKLERALKGIDTWKEILPDLELLEAELKQMPQFDRLLHKSMQRRDQAVKGLTDRQSEETNRRDSLEAKDTAPKGFKEEAEAFVKEEVSRKEAAAWNRRLNHLEARVRRLEKLMEASQPTKDGASDTGSVGL